MNIKGIVTAKNEHGRNRRGATLGAPVYNLQFQFKGAFFPESIQISVPKAIFESTEIGDEWKLSPKRERD